MFKSPKHKKFSYTPRFSNQQEKKNVEKENAKFGDFSSKWRNHQGLRARKPKRGLSLLVMVLLLGLMLIAMYILDIKFN